MIMELYLTIFKNGISTPGHYLGKDMLRSHDLSEDE